MIMPRHPLGLLTSLGPAKLVIDLNAKARSSPARGARACPAGHSRCPGASAHDRDPAARTACGWPARPWCPLATRAQAVAERVSVHARQRPAAPPSSAPAAPALPASGCPPSWIACAPARPAGASSGLHLDSRRLPVLDTGKTAPGVDSRPGSRPGCSRVRPWHAAAIVVLDRSRSSLCRAEQGGPGQPTVRNARCAGLRGRQCYAVASADDGAIALTRPASHLIGSSSGLRPEAPVRRPRVLPGKCAAGSGRAGPAGARCPGTAAPTTRMTNACRQDKASDTT